jgi:hypothetical protein
MKERSRKHTTSVNRGACVVVVVLVISIGGGGGCGVSDLASFL